MVQKYKIQGLVFALLYKSTNGKSLLLNKGKLCLLQAQFSFFLLQFF